MRGSWTSRRMEGMGACMPARKGSRVPKSVVSVMTATSTIAIDHEVCDQCQRFSLLRRHEGRQRGFGRPGVLVRLGHGVLHALVIEDVAPDRIDLLRAEGVALEEALHALGLGGC